MAIDDNTSYELTGYQVKDLAGRIRLKADASAIPTVNDATLTITQNGTSVGTFTANASSNATIALTDTTYSAMTGATSGAAGTSGLVPAPAAGDEAKVLSGAGTWVNQPTAPTVNDGTLTIQHNGTTKGTFTANQSTASTVNIETIYADTPGTATTPAASVQASDINWSTMPFNYSTTEVDTGCTWIDGKPIYKKTYSMGALINGGGTLAQNISSLDFETVVELRGIAINPTTKNVRPLPLVANELSDMVRIDVTNNAIRVITTTGSSWATAYNAYVTLWYTKTTD